uniref:Uncharacterized protein n=1 Tax=Candidatus Kentrum sp. LPFa TaxID=2126335 RepID=A0A450WZA9_9GAMM|nr:MAG: hypothetical protein BECKLPF1236B_GA0070989_13075 [Candidatus Kentron sp. LPFa]
MRLVNLPEVIGFHRKIIAQPGGSEGIHDRGALESVLAQGYRDLAVRLDARFLVVNHNETHSLYRDFRHQLSDSPSEQNNLGRCPSTAYKAVVGSTDFL